MINHSPGYYDRRNSADGFSNHDIDTQKLWDQFIEDFSEHSADYECDKAHTSDIPCEFSANVISSDDCYPAGLIAPCSIHRGKKFINNPHYQD